MASVSTQTTPIFRTAHFSACVVGDHLPFDVCATHHIADGALAAVGAEYGRHALQGVRVLPSNHAMHRVGPTERVHVLARRIEALCSP